MKSISIDIETFSSVSLQKSGVYRYAESDDFEILLFGYSVDGGEVKVVDLAMGEKIPDDIIDALTDDEVIKWAFNAQFERVCLSRYLREKGVSLKEYIPTVMNILRRLILAGKLDNVDLDILKASMSGEVIRQYIPTKNVIPGRVYSTRDGKAYLYLGRRADDKRYVYVDMSSDDRMKYFICLLYTSPSPRDDQPSRMPSSA